ncbi:unnamed protein product [Tilletia laevis]|uniref:Uncharacterized protein n=1 Tax=Tilletia laevis TaxID=157183 RepID=A0A9N8LWX5_9BASI|nr:hypothetical protein CF335_g9042 [Tilletia laevis]KAE8190560.1 hypothetical protein CF336_g5252 [Tilletia laevis]CAD6914204.1 unnamed protein product [Tilletia laevis]CAD6944463.1 unnamed protein product [Tilletia laevis]
MAYRPDTDLRRAARAQLATSSPTAIERSAPPSILNQQIHSHGEGSGAISVGDNSAKRMTWETELQQLQADLNLFQSALPGYHSSSPPRS